MLCVAYVTLLLAPLTGSSLFPPGLIGPGSADLGWILLCCGGPSRAL